MYRPQREIDKSAIIIWYKISQYLTGADKTQYRWFEQNDLMSIYRIEHAKTVECLLIFKPTWNSYRNWPQTYRSIDSLGKIYIEDVSSSKGPVDSMQSQSKYQWARTWQAYFKICTKIKRLTIVKTLLKKKKLRKTWSIHCWDLQI